MTKQKLDADAEAKDIIGDAYISQNGWPFSISIPIEIIERVADRIKRAGSSAIAEGPLEIIVMLYFKHRKQALAPLDIPDSIDVSIHEERQDIIGGCLELGLPIWSSPRQMVSIETNQETIVLDIERLEPLRLSPSDYIIREVQCVSTT